MPIATTYPGVYIEEVPSGVRTITGVATSITAFLGRTRLGSNKEPTTVNSFGDFERQFGGLDVERPLSYAVRDFYLNGGSQALIVRLYNPELDESQNPLPGKAIITIDGLELSAKSPGFWGNNLRANIDVEVSEEVRTRMGLEAEDRLFNLTVRHGDTIEKFINLTNKDNARRIDRVLKAESSLIEYAWPNPAPSLHETKTAVDDYQAMLADPTNETKKNNYKNSLLALEDSILKAEKALIKTENDLIAAKKTLSSTEEDPLVIRKILAHLVDKAVSSLTRISHQHAG